MLKTCLAAILAGAVLAAHAQSGPQPAVDWEVQVVRDGRTIDTFEHTTTIGQARTDTHNFPAVLPAACGPKAAAAAAPLSRSVTVAPLYIDGDAITLAIDAQETLVDDSVRDSMACAPESPRQIAASHPGLSVHADSWTDWTLVDKHPRLVYRVRAHVVQN